VIRFRISLDEGDADAPVRTPRASILAYRSSRDRGAPSFVPQFIRDLMRDSPSTPGAVAGAMGPEDLELNDSGDDELDEPDAPRASEGTEDGAANTWASLVEISTERPILGSAGLPFSWEVIAPGRADTTGGAPAVPSPVLRVVAAPGVRVLLLPPISDDEPLVRVDVIRVQDPRSVPTLGEPIDASLLLTGNGVGMHRSGSSFPYVDLYSRMHMARFGGSEDADFEAFRDLFATGLRNRRVSVMPQRDGVMFFDNVAERMLEIRVRVLSRAYYPGDSRSDVQARFGYQIRQDADIHEPCVTVAATASVQVRQYYYGAFEAGDAIAPDLTAAQRAMEPFVVLRVPDFDAVPFPGRPVEAPERPTPAGPTMIAPRSVFHAWEAAEIPFIEPPPELRLVLARAGADVMVSMIPVVGDAIDVMELGLALVTGRDRWGQRVGFLDLGLMAMGAALPFVNRRELQLSLLAGQLAAGGAMLAPGFLEGEDEGP
jgi:hypothetical protein